jgi:hypothetical protein
MNCLKNNEEVRPEEEDLELQRSNSERRVNIMWRSCCLELNRDFTIFFTKYIILISLMIFFSFELHIAKDCNDKQLYTSLLTLIIGVAIPSPRLK